jgi:GT2 family glycosyltransferase
MLRRTLNTLFRSATASTMEVIVVDNGSVDGSLEMVREEFPAVRLVASGANEGFARGNNLGMSLAMGRHLFLLNNDTIVLDNTIDPLASYLDLHPEVGAVGGKVLNIDGSVQGSVKSLPTPMAALAGRHSLLARFFPNNRLSRRYLIYLDQDFSQPFPAGSVSACAMMVRREAIAAAGPFDEGYFVYWSDVDWCRAIWESGYQVHCVPESVIVHDEHKGGTRADRRQSKAAVVDFHRGAYRYFRKWHAPRPWQPAGLLALAGLTARGLAVLVSEGIRWRLRSRRRAA